jgi:hypothetical protein
VAMPQGGDPIAPPSDERTWHRRARFGHDQRRAGAAQPGAGG